MNILGQKTGKVLHSGKTITVEMFVIGRKGWKAPRDVYLKYDGRWITPFEQRRREWTIPASFLLWMIYCGESYKDLIYTKNPFLELIPKDTNWGGKYIPVLLRDE